MRAFCSRDSLNGPRAAATRVRCDDEPAAAGGLGAGVAVMVGEAATVTVVLETTAAAIIAGGEVGFVTITSGEDGLVVVAAATVGGGGDGDCRFGATGAAETASAILGGDAD